ncbi:hypothetical protein [Mycobacterium sp. Z3061]|uniref:hypothetical protein n=1 Tax=Mycobacterium sp. Z3061 TaxID=3073562 RepID=UPI0028733844|nr:hypothetical protein [Mycobacterium sp. Z3061]
MRYGRSRRNRGAPALVGVRWGTVRAGGTGGLLFGSGGVGRAVEETLAASASPAMGVMVAPVAGVDPAAKSR